jgi:hypothetical protein
MFDGKERDIMFGDMAFFTISVSLTITAMMLMMFMWYMSRSSSDRDPQKAVVYEKRTD